MVKRIFDIIACSVAIIVLSPIFAVIAVLIKMNSKGSVVFKQERVGKGNRPFTFYKFRTMRTEANSFGKSPETGDDPRLVKYGKFLREYSLDELPQLFNVIKGDMSIVGPRALYVSQVVEFSNYHKKRLEVKPGITGLSQIYFRSELTSDKSLDLEVEYVQNQGFWSDIKIIFLTVAVVIGKKGVYER